MTRKESSLKARDAQSEFGICGLLTEAFKVCLGVVHVSGPLQETRMALRLAKQNVPWHTVERWSTDGDA